MMKSGLKYEKKLTFLKACPFVPAIIFMVVSDFPHAPKVHFLWGKIDGI